MNKHLIRSFGGGEITPELFGRIDLTQLQTGLQLCRNFRTMPHGPAENRAGTAFVCEVKYSAQKTRLIPFSFSVTQTLVIELGNLYARFHTLDGTVLNTAVNISGVTQASPGVFTSSAPHGLTVGQWVFIAGLGGMVQLNNRFFIVATTPTGSTFTLTDTAGNAINTASLPAYTSGGTVASVYEITTPYLATEVFGINYVQSNDVVTLVHANHPPADLSRFAATNWTYVPINFTPAIAAVSDIPTLTKSGAATTTAYRYGVTVKDPSSNAESPLIEAAVATSKVNAMTFVATAVFTTVANHGFSTGQLVYGKALGDALFAAGYPTDETYFTINTVPAANQYTLAKMDGTVVDGTQVPAGNQAALAVVLAASTPAVYTVQIQNDLTIGGNSNTVTWPWHSSYQGKRFNVYAYSRGLWGFVGQTLSPTFTDNNITPDISNSPPLLYAPFMGSGNYPSAVTYFEQRRYFAGSQNNPQTVWATKSATQSDLSYSIPPKATDAIQFTIASRDANPINHMVPLAELLVLTGATEFRMTSLNSDNISAVSFSMRPQTYIGSNGVQPLIVNNVCIFAQARGGRVRELLYGYQAYTATPVTAYICNDISMMAPHLFDYSNIVDMALMKAPYQILWMVSSNGSLLGCTYLPAQQVLGWHHHDTSGGTFESVACVTEGNEDLLYVIVNRTINGRQVRYIEQMQSRLVSDPTQAWFVDAGLKYTGSPQTTFYGLNHLEGQTVNILADGGVAPQAVVTNGSITLAQAASTVIVGLPITAQIQTLPLVMEGMAAGSQGSMKNVNKAYLRVSKSSGIWAGPDFKSLVQYKQRNTEPYGSAPALVTDEIELVIDPSWNLNGAICIQQTDPLPATIDAMVLEVALGD